MKLIQASADAPPAKSPKKLRAVAKNKQVLCITHLAQLASKADNHYLIEKKCN